MADQNNSIVSWVIAGFVILLIGVVFFVMPSQGPKPGQGNFTVNTSSQNSKTNTTKANATIANTTSNTTANTTVTPVNETRNQSCVLIEFYGAECPHCKNMAPVVAQVENETGITFTQLEIWYNTTNQAIFQSYSKDIQKDCGSLGVPTFTILGVNDSYLSTSRCGEMIESDLKYFVTSNCGKI